MIEVVEDYKLKGIPLEKLRFNQSMPDEKLIIQGGVMKSTRFLELTYTTVKKPMNSALGEEELYVNGLRAQIILRENLWPSSLSDLETILENFPNSAVEFSSYSVAVGDILNRNTVFWEVRDY